MGDLHMGRNTMNADATMLILALLLFLLIIVIHFIHRHLSNIERQQRKVQNKH